MSDESQTQSRVGRVGWIDLTVPNATEVSDFYSDVIGWGKRGESMGEYEDYHMLAPGTDESVAGVCHARGINAHIPPMWLPYFLVSDVDEAYAKARELGAEVITPLSPEGMTWRFAILRDPAGAAFALFQA